MERKVGSEEKLALALGFFDGLHKGHKTLIERTVQAAKEYGYTPAVLTFDKSPTKLLKDTVEIKYILTCREKRRILKEMGIKRIVTLEFNEKFMLLSPEEFVDEILVKDLHAGFVAAGFNYRFGHKASGDGEILKKLCAEKGVLCETLPPFSLAGQVVSATAIRSAILSGDVRSAAEMMGRFFVIDEIVEHGKEVGRLLNSPTINQRVSKEYILPRNGVYVSRTEIEGKYYRSVTNIGKRPTVDDSENINAETHIIGINLDLYGKRIRVELLEKIRDEQKYPGLEELKSQIQADISSSIKYFEQNHLQQIDDMIK